LAHLLHFCVDLWLHFIQLPTPLMISSNANKMRGLQAFFHFSWQQLRQAGDSQISK
jgi:hypothetical protein